MKNIFKNKTILITGGTGSFGKVALEYCLKLNFKKIIIFSRDELKQFNLQKKYESKNLRFFIGDVRDFDRLKYAFREVNYVVHAAALKQVPTAEYNPIEAIKTNVIGAENIIRSSIDNRVEKVMALSTDKAENPINLYGATKLCSDKLFIAANNYSGGIKTSFSVTRYGNVIGSRGSVFETFSEMIKSKKTFLPITDFRMTRFWIKINDGVDFVFKNINRMKGGEIFIPKIPSVKIVDIAKLFKKDIKLKEVGLRPGEKLHEVLLSKDSSHHSVEFKNYFVIMPEFNFKKKKNKGKKLPEDFEYNSFNNPKYLSEKELRKIKY